MERHTPLEAYAVAHHTHCVLLTFSASFSQIEWDTDPGTREVQWIKTYADTDPNELQSITTTADDVDEVQRITISANETQEVQVSRAIAAELVLTFITMGSVVSFVCRVVVRYAGLHVTCGPNLFHSARVWRSTV